MERQILHIDVNNAFLSWSAVEMLRNGYERDIRKIPAVIGGDETKRSGIVLAKSMKAKEFGIKTADTIYHAKIKCPNLEIFPSKFEVYIKYSTQLYNLLLQYTQIIEKFSIDECFLDMTNYLQGKKLIDIAKEINLRVKEELGFTVNIGISNNKLLAKMASDFTKPDRIHTLYKDEIQNKMWNLPISELFMLGKRTVPKLHNMQIKTIGDLAKADKNIIVKKLGKHGLLLWEYANGIDNTEVVYKQEKPKGVGNSITLPQNISEIKKIEEIVLALSEQVAYRLRKHKMKGKVVSLQLRTKDFEDKSHQSKMDFPTANTKIIYQKAKKLLQEMYIEGTSIRLVGLRIDNLVENTESQLSMFENTDLKKQEELDKTLDMLKEKYGYYSIKRAGEMNADKFLKLKGIKK